MDATDILEELLVEHDADEIERDALIAEVTAYLFGPAGKPVLSLDMTLFAMWLQWDELTDKVDVWKARYQAQFARVHAQLKVLPRGKAFAAERRRLQDALDDANWRGNCARHVLYWEYPAVQDDLTALLRGCWEESGWDELTIDDRLDEWGNTITERRCLYQLRDWTLAQIAGHIALD